MRWETLDRDLYERFPAIRGRIQEESEWWSPDPIAQDPLIGDVFTPYFLALLEQSPPDGEALERAVDTIEEMIVHDDGRIRDTALVSILESIEDHPRHLEIARKLFRTETLERLPTKEWIDEHSRRDGPAQED